MNLQSTIVKKDADNTALQSKLNFSLEELKHKKEDVLKLDE